MDDGTKEARQTTRAAPTETPSSEYSLKAVVNWPGFMFHNRKVEATEAYMWVLNGQDIGMVHDIKAEGIDLSVATDKLRILRGSHDEREATLL